MFCKFPREKQKNLQRCRVWSIEKDGVHRMLTGYRGRKEIDGTQILIPDAPRAKDTYYQRKKKHKLFCKRAGIEPTIGHLKTDYRLGRNFYKGLVGDAINVYISSGCI